MASVTDLTTTGDNDPEIFPVQYYRHYMYCDRCGSFQIEPWVEPDNHRQLAGIRKRIEQGASLCLIIAIISFVVGLVSFIANLVFAGTLTMPIYSLLGSGLSLIALFFMLGMASFVEAKVRYRGLRCGACLETYENGGAFFTSLANNPRNYSMKDVPRPLPFWLRGETPNK